MQKRRIRLGGFTIVELLVVISIITLLLGILLPTVTKARAAGSRVVCQSNVRQLFVGVLNYCNDNHDWYPTCSAPVNTIQFTEMDADWVWWQQDRDVNLSPIAIYLNTRNDRLKQLLRCPADLLANHNIGPATVPGQGPYSYSYSINQGVGENVKPPLSWRTKRGQWRHPAEKILFTEPYFESLAYNPSAGWNYATPLTRRHGHGITSRTGALMGIGASTVFMDGHVAGIDENLSSDIRQNHPDDY